MGKRVWWAVLSVLGFGIAWTLASAYIFNPYLVPPPLVVLKYLWKMAFVTGELWEHVLISMQRILIGYFWGNVIGISIGILMGRFFIVRSFLDPLVSFLRAFSPVALIPMAIVWFGVGETSKYFVILYGCAIIILLNTIDGVMSTPLIRIRAAQCLGASDFKIFTKIIIPSAWPYILTGMRVTLGISFAGLVAAEMIAADAGIGYLIVQATLMLTLNEMFVGLLCLGILGVITDQIYQYVIAKTMRRYMQEGK